MSLVFALFFYLYVIYAMVTWMHLELSFSQWEYYIQKYFRGTAYESLEDLHLAEDSYDMLVKSWGFKKEI